MIDEAHGWGIANRSILRTINGGMSWSNVTPSELAAIVLAIPAAGLSSFELKGSFLNAQAAWIAVPGLDKITIFSTIDGSQSWQTTELVVSAPQQVFPIQITSFAFLNIQTGWLLRATQGSAAHEYVDLYQSQDSGATWNLIAQARSNISGGETGSITTLGQKTGVSFRDSTNGWLTGYSAGNTIYIIRTGDGGLTWDFQQLPIPRGFTAEGGSARSYPATFFDDKKGLMPVYLGKTSPGINLFFYTTADGGDSWLPTSPLNSQTNDFVWSWPDSSHGFAAEEGTGLLYSTSDAGGSWSKITQSGLKLT